MPIVDLPVTMNYPRVCHHLEHLLRAFSGEKIAMLDTRLMEKEWDFETHTVRGCTVSIARGFVEHAGIGREWLEQELGEGIACYVPAYGGGAWLPLTLPMHWILQPSDSPAPTAISGGKDQGLPYARVEYVDETCIAELCCNAWKYKFDETRGLFVRHSAPLWNAAKGRLRMELLPVTGGTDERVADYGRLILFLLAKVELSDEERSMLAPLLARAPAASSLSGVISRESLVQRFVAEVKANPAALLKWDGDWTRFWWESTKNEQEQGGKK